MTELLGSLLTKLETETLTTMSRSSTELEVVTSHASHAPHASSEESLENAVGINVVEAVTSAILQVLTTVIHPSLLLITEYGISLSNLQ